jgi:membrane-associated PAP2 superfamily phosphatase
VSEYTLKKRVFELAGVLLALLLLTAVCWLTNADLRISAAVSGADNSWPLGGQFPWNVLYDRASLPAFVLTVGAVFVLGAGFFVRSLASFRRKAVFILLLLALGPGLVVNVLLKDHLGRARPREVIEFGGSYQYTPVWQAGSTGKNSSFPSGHAAIAFFLMAPWFVLRDDKQRIAACFLVSGLVFGSLVSIARVLQGGHFVTDVFWSAGFIYLVGGTLTILFFRPHS